MLSMLLSWIGILKSFLHYKTEQVKFKSHLSLFANHSQNTQTLCKKETKKKKKNINPQNNNA